MAETLLWCELHRAAIDPNTTVELSQCWRWYVGDECSIVERVLSVPGELVDPAKVDYEAAMHALIGLAKSGDLYPTHSDNWRKRAAAVVDAALAKVQTDPFVRTSDTEGSEPEGHDIYYCQSHQATSWSPNGCWVEAVGPEPCRLVRAILVVPLSPTDKEEE